MSESVFFKWVEIEGFRGFAERQRLDLDASVVIVAGPNGTGKTSFFDALQWLLIGTLERLEPWRVRRNAEHIVNQYRADAGEPARVTAALDVDGRSVELRRSGRHDSSQLEWREDGTVLLEDEAAHALARVLTPAGRVSLQQSLLSSGLLQQDVIRDVLEDKPASRYDQLAALLGLNAIAGFPAAAKRRADRLAEDGQRARDVVTNLEEATKNAGERLMVLRARAEQREDVATLRDRLASQLAAHSGVITLAGELPVSAGDARKLRQTAGLAADTLSQLLAEWVPTIEEQASELVDADQLDRLREAMQAAAGATEEARQALADAEERYVKERNHSSQLERLAAEAIPLLGEACPVCGQSIDADHVRTHLEGVIAVGSNQLPAMLKARDEAAASLASREAAEAEARRVFEEALARIDQTSSARRKLDAWRARVVEAIGAVPQRIELGHREALINGDAASIRVTQEALGDLSRRAGELSTALEWVEEAQDLSSTETRLGEINDELEEARRHAARASAIEDEARTLQRAAVRAATAVSDQRFAVLEPIIQDIYARLDPHPAFTRLHFAVDVYREKSIATPQVLDPERELHADPLLVFSSSQANVVALSAFLAFGWAAGQDAMPFLLLDDPLQSLDDVNALGFSDLCRHMRTRRQLIVSTHDMRLAKLLQRKLAPRRIEERTRYLEFIAWSRTGPLVDESDVAPQIDQGTRRALIPT